MPQDFLGRLKGGKSVLQRTGKDTKLPKLVFYIEWIAGEGKRKVLDAEGGEHQITDLALQSNYKMVTGSKAKKLITDHWADAVPKST